MPYVSWSGYGVVAVLDGTFHLADAMELVPEDIVEYAVFCTEMYASHTPGMSEKGFPLCFGEGIGEVDGKVGGFMEGHSGVVKGVGDG